MHRETHIIGGAIIPLWQRFKTHEEARLRVVRVTADDGQRIVGIRIPPEHVGPIVRALGATRDLREPGEIFAGVLDEGKEVTLVSGSNLCRRFLYREPVIELCGADPYKFAGLRSLGLINEQILCEEFSNGELSLLRPSNLHRSQFQLHIIE